MKRDLTVERKSARAFGAKRKKLLFYSLFIAIPTLHYLIFYLYINLDSVLLAFRKYGIDASKGVLSYTFAGWGNFAEAFKILGQSGARTANSFIFLAVSIFVSTPLALLFSFYIYKKRCGTEFFRVILFLPQILSAVIFGVLYRYMCNQVAGWFAENVFNADKVNFLYDQNYQMGAVILFNIIMSFGVNVLTYSGTMSGVNQSLSEAAELDGCKPLQEFWYITVPMIWPTVATLMIVTFSRVFTEQWQVLTLLSRTPGKVDNIGYFLYTKVVDGNLVTDAGNPNQISYSVLSALGLILTALILPTTMVLRKLLDKYGPKAE